MEMTQDEEQEVTTEKEEGNFCDQCLLEYGDIKGKFVDLEDEWMNEQRSFVFSKINMIVSLNLRQTLC